MEKQYACDQFAKDMQIRNFSSKTSQGYMSQINRFIDYCGEVPPKIQVEQFREYLLYLKTIKLYSASSLNLAYSALKMFYTRIINEPWPEKLLGRAKLEFKLPQFFTQDEIKRIFSGIINLKHKAILTLMYSSGLRISELILLTPKDIDSKQMYVVVRGGKGKKDRTTLLSTKCLELLREYYKKYRPVKYLFNGLKNESPYSKTSIKKILQKATLKANIKKKLHPIPCATALPHIYWKTDAIYFTSKNY